jgi:MYXO-CTERM domain-containing protein
MAIDGDPFTKYPNLGRENSGFIVKPNAGRSIVQSFTITTANDFPERDPTSWELYGTNEPLESFDNSNGSFENWTLIDSGILDLPLDRFTPAGPFTLNSFIAYDSYRMVFTGVRDPAANSMQFADIQFEGLVIPEPGSALLAALGLGAFGQRRHRSRRG